MVTEMGLYASQISHVRFVPFQWAKKNSIQRIMKGLRMLARNYQPVYWDDLDFETLVKPIKDENFDIIYANDIESLPLAIRLKKNAKIVFDAHEYSPRQNENILSFRIFLMGYIDYLCRTFIPQADAMITVSWGIADEYSSKYGVKPEVMTNAPDPVNLKPVDVNEHTIKLIYHGEVSASRHTESMIQMIDFVDERFSLDLMIKSSDINYMEKLTAMVRQRKNIRIIPPVDMKNIIAFTNSYDIGIYILKPNSFNQTYALPNKFFEYIQARLAIAIGPSPEMARIVKEFDLGLVSKDFSPESLAHELNSLTKSDIEYFKNQSHRAASQLSSEQNLKILDNIIGRLIHH